MQIFVGAAIAHVVVEPVAVTRLLGIAAARDDVQRDAAVRHVVQRGRGACGQRGRHDAGPVRDEVAQALGVRGRVARHREPLGRRRGVPHEHAVEAGLLVSLGEGAQPRRVDGAADHVHGRAVRALRLHSDHADDLDGHAGDAIPPAATRSTAGVDVLLLVPVVIFVAYLVFGITGFGAAPITIPVLVTRRQADTREVVTLVPFTLLGLTLGVTLLLRLPRDATLLALGLFVCAYAVNLMLRRESRRRVSRLWAAPAGIVSGLVGALFGMGEPPYVMYLILNVGLRRRVRSRRAPRLPHALARGRDLAARGLGRGVGRSSRAHRGIPAPDGRPRVRRAA